MASGAARSQNIVTNPSFESYCPTGLTQIGGVPGWETMTGHFGTPEAFNTCGTSTLVTVPNNLFGSQSPITGDGYVGFSLISDFIPDFREYVQNTLQSPMIAGKNYCVTFYSSTAEISTLSSDNALEVHFSSAPLNGGGVGTNVPTTAHYQSTILLDDKVNWIQHTFTYTATGGEQYMTFGNFKPDVTTSVIPDPTGSGFFLEHYVYIEDVSVVPMSDATITPIAALCASDPSVNLTGADAGGTWSGTGIIDANAGTFDPAVAGIGTHTITYSIAGPCGDTQTEDIVVSNCSLPVELLAFDAQAVDHRKVALTWTTINEINNDYFEIERSQDGTTFSTIAWADGAGNSNVTLHYNDFDLEPYNGISYYRLKQTDFDGTYTYSDIRTVIFDDLSFVNLYPNPANEELQFTVLVSEDADLHVNIVDVTGRIIMQEKHFIEAGESTITLNTTNLASGMYTIRVNTNDENHLSKEFIRR